MEIVKLASPESFLAHIKIKNDSLLQKMWSDESLTVQGLEEVYDTYETYLVYEDEDVIGGFLLLEKDYSYWTPEENQDNAYYVHKLFVLPQFNGRGYAGKIMERIKEYAKQEHKDYLRLDCRRHNEKLNHLYESLDFQFKREFDSNFSGEMNLREYQVK